MADFCVQCWGEVEYCGDLAGISTERDTQDKKYPIVLCEGCGPTQVDHTGRCVAPDCLEHHG